MATDTSYELVVYASTTGKVLLKEELEGIADLAWTPDGSTVVGLMDDRTVRRWRPRGQAPGAQRDDLEDLALVDLTDVPTWTSGRTVSVGRPAESLSVAPDGRIAVAPVDGGVQLVGADGSVLGTVGGGGD